MRLCTQKSIKHRQHLIICFIFRDIDSVRKYCKSQIMQKADLGASI